MANCCVEALNSWRRDNVVGMKRNKVPFDKRFLFRCVYCFAAQVDPERPVLVDKYLDRADELDVDALCDKDGNVTICGIMQHIEQARRPPSFCATLTA